MAKIKIAEFSGAEQLAEAGRAVLEDLSLDGAIIRDAVTDIEALKVTGMPIGRVASFYAAVPESRKLDEVVREWAPNHIPPTLRIPTNFTQSSVNNRPKAAHTDVVEGENPQKLIFGPLTISVRVDPHSLIRRYFEMQRIRRSTINSDGSLKQQVIPLGTRMLLHAGIDGFSRVEQRIGDIVIIPNHPYPAIHTVVQPKKADGGRPAGLLFDYQYFPR